jgi:hypothetical protein
VKKEKTRSFTKEFKAFITLLEEFDEKSPLVNYTHRILCEMHKNTYIKLGQPENVKNDDGTETGPSNEQAFIENKIWNEKYHMYQTVGEILNHIRTEMLNRILRGKKWN